MHAHTYILSICRQGPLEDDSDFNFQEVKLNVAKDI
jgi:6-pyruvoyl-tetrahydropterin synthase